MWIPQDDLTLNHNLTSIAFYHLVINNIKFILTKCICSRFCRCIRFMVISQSPIWGCVIVLIIAPDMNLHQNPSRTSSKS